MCKMGHFNTTLKVRLYFVVFAVVQLVNCVQLFRDPMDYIPPGSSVMGFSRQEYWSEVPCPPPGNLPNPGIEPGSPALQADSLPSEPPVKPLLQKKATKGIVSFLFGQERRSQPRQHEFLQGQREKASEEPGVQCQDKPPQSRWRVLLPRVTYMSVAGRATHPIHRNPRTCDPSHLPRGNGLYRWD